jgi:hypothetical protein
MAKFNYTKWITENKYGKFDEEALGSETPIPLSQLDPELAKTAATSGGGTGSPDETQGNADATIAVGSLKPAQKEVIAAKALCFALGFLRDGTPDLEDMEAIISNDKYIMDGHHRWAARTLIDPTAEVGVAKIELPADELITVLNIYTKGVKKKEKGNPGVGAISSFKTDIPDLIDTVMAEGTGVLKYHKGPWPVLTAEEVNTSLGKVPGANGDAAKGAAKMKANANKLNTEIHPNAPSRVDMPVIDGDEIPDVLAKLKSGKIDFKPNYSDETKAKLGKAGLDEQEKELGNKELGDVEILMKNIDRINTQQELEQVIQKLMNHIASGKVTGGAMGLTKALGTGPASTIKKQFGIKESVDPRSSLYERIEKLIDKK